MIVKWIIHSLVSSHLVVFSLKALTALTFRLKHEMNFERELHKRSSFLHTVTQVLDNIQGYDRYILEEPSPGLESDLTLESTITFHEWLR